MAPRILVVECDPGAPVGRLGEWLAAAGLELDVVPASDVAGDARSDALLVLGGRMSSADDRNYPWLGTVRELLARSVAAEVPTLGICLGAQLLAQATGGRVGEDPDSSEVGASLIAKRGLASVDPLLRDLPITPDVIQWHFDAVLSLPPSAQLLASSPGCEVQAFRVGRLAWGLQAHIETTPEIVRGWVRDELDLFEDYDLAGFLARVDAAHADIEQTWRPVAEKFADIVRDPDSVAAVRETPTSVAAPITDPAAIRAALAAEAMAASRLPGPVFLPTPRPLDS